MSSNRGLKESPAAGMMVEISFLAPVQKEKLIQKSWMKKEVVSELGQGLKGNCILEGCHTLK